MTSSPSNSSPRARRWPTRCGACRSTRATARLLDSKVADINNVSAGGFGGAITAALYLQEFVPDDVPWAHFDMMAWNSTSRPGRPEGGEAQAARAIFATIEKRVTR